MEPATMMGIGALMSGAGSLAGLFGGGGGSAARASENMYLQGLQFQREMAQNGVRWRVEDAKAAGVHPLFALGAQLPSASPGTYIAAEGGRGSKVGDALEILGRTGQNYARAAHAGMTAAERIDDRMRALTLERGELENDLLRAQIAKERAQLGPGLPMPGSSQFMPGQADIERLGLTVSPAQAHIEQKPMALTVPNPLNTSQEPHAVADLGFTWTGTGYAPVPSKDAKERLEDMGIPQAMWSWRNSILPNFGVGNPPPAHLIPEGFNNWRWSVTKQEWQPDYNPHRARIPVQRIRRGHHGPDTP